MANQADIKAVITAEDRASATLRSFGDNVGSVGHKIAGVAEVAAKALLAGGVAAVGFGALTVKAYQESQDAQAQLGAALTSTHHAAGLYIEDLNDQARALQEVTKFSDEQINSSQALLLTFRDIHGAIFQQATPAILDMATAMHEDLQSATIQVGKALNDPITGITALRRVGVTFNDTQKEQIKHFVETNQAAKAQGIILKELQAEFGGSATAAGKTFGGQLIILKNRLNDIEETIGQVIVRYLTPLIAKIADFVQKVNWNAVIQRSVTALRELAAEIGHLTGIIINWGRATIEYLTPGIQRFIFVLQELANVFVKWILPSIMPVISAIKDRLWPQIVNLWRTIEPGFTTALRVLAIILGVTLIAAIKVFLIALNAAISVMGFAIRVASTLIGWFGNLGGVIVNIFRGIPNAIAKAFSGLAKIIIAPFKAAFDWIEARIRQVKNAMEDVKNAASSVVNAPGKAVGGVRHFIGSHIPHLAEGGIVTKPTLALIGEGNSPEAVVPLNKAGAMGGNITIQINAGAFMGSKIEARKYALDIVKALQQHATSKNTNIGNILGVNP